MSEAHEDAIQTAKDPAKGDQKEKPAETGVAATGQAAKSLIEALTEFGKLVLIVVVLFFLWSNRANVERYASQWLDSANKLGFLGWSIERQISAEEAVAKIVNDKPELTNAKFAEGAIERAARNAPAIVGSRVMWVDDHSSNNDQERNVLEALGIEVFSVKSTKDALTILPVVKPDLVIGDVGRDNGEVALPLRNCPAHYFEAPGKDLAAINAGLMQGNTQAVGFSLPEAIPVNQAKYRDHASPRIIFYSSSAGGMSASQCARLVTNRPDVLLHNVISALEEIRWEKLKKQPLSDRQPEKEKQPDKKE
jgi:CheY-like chemotaxis protein